MRSKTRGFTLIEVLITISLLGLLMVIVSSALILSNRTLSINDGYSDRLNEIRSVHSFLRSSLQKSLPFAFLRDTKDTLWIFDGEKEIMRFVAPMPSHLSGGVQLHSLEVVDNDNTTGSLQIRFSQITPQGLAPWGTPQTLLRNIKHLTFNYKGLDNNQRVTTWLEHWQWPDRLPQYVKVSLETEGPIAWPPLIVALRLGPVNEVGVTP